jgi:hypothetical protein
METTDMSNAQTRTVLGAHDYDVVVGAMTRTALPKVVGTCASRWPHDFVRAAQAVAPTSMLMLASQAQVNLAMLADPGFDAAHHLCEQLGSYDFAHTVEHSRLGREIDVSSEVSRLLGFIGGLDPDSAKALWAGIAFAQWLGHGEDETRLNRWLDVAYLQSFAA